ncbi:DUF378 domain-containing protein [Clostridium chauvoei]|uniref:DUF378 domain-containing protein n=2 Tax=Clostridium chauvoei TaxID=46867 RepID=S6EZ78_9CLOT|nr:DUF378 domain-containing protein [Clostridium chauvoei]ATD54990.1 DUF378 domain-containing protein [Clostridium chauvoei]ATD57333.1 DUF378 domain-containing protein [Clostridium chauvoei]MBX7281509.1 DUF378 domain-containing protein [Clostridium chauvoei]MBX7284044.1 DUF378 domain-containing protein [Clostridium chauvoei]MBX7286557.1 DUF378 domain-containing protein [Clostridium chauvoei]
MCKITLLDKLSFILVLISAITWGIIGIFNVNIIALISGNSILIQRAIYILVFAAAINLILVLFKCKSLSKIN